MKYNIDAFKKTWHCRLATKYCSFELPHDGKIQFCPYLRKVLLGGVFAFLFIPVMFSIFFLAVMEAPAVWISYLFTGVWIDYFFFTSDNLMYAISFILWVIVGIGVAIYSGMRIVSWFKKLNIPKINIPKMPSAKIRERLPEAPPFFKTWFSSIHEKICPTIELEKKD